MHLVAPPVHDETAGVVALEEARAHGKYIVSQKPADLCAYRNDPFLVTLAPDQDKAAVQVDVGKADVGDLGASDARVVEQLQDDPVTVAPVGVAVRGCYQPLYIRLVEDRAGK